MPPREFSKTSKKRRSLVSKPPLLTADSSLHAPLALRNDRGCIAFFAIEPALSGVEGVGG